ncbi:hypothetical protein GXW83_30670 [Streptacidiphilus sp. PB12-B1b]|uniref:PD40 domain-containing protein n=1 Tax=Streptacidiphilus sp. PB12-B1b TaxID=2705012 RepID=UPI0015F95E76|nr:PD40 domain-containing protein [Streptacidiphilus sp. PB12-B1b]QMU79426.1 hypothetical protein GXW83_30670 [Streptacidiphilus sp. PB12-B1b]
MLSSAATLAAGIVGTLGATAAHAATPAAGVLAFRTSSGEAAVINSDGSGERLLPALSYGSFGRVAWSSDGSRVASAVNGVLASSRPDGSSAFQLTPAQGNADDAAFGWSGSDLLTDADGQIYAQTSDAVGAPVRLMNSSTEPASDQDTQPDVSPTGLVAFARSTNGGTQNIWTYSTGTGKAAELVGNAYQPVYSADGSTLLFLRQVDGQPAQAYAIKANGTGTAVQLTDDPNGVQSASLSPDGHTLAYASYEPAAADQVVKTLALGVAGASPVTVAPGTDPVWQPVQAQQNGLFDIYGTGGLGTDDAASRWDYNAAGTSKAGLVTAFNAVLVNRSDQGDAPAAVALAAEKQGPLLMTSGGSLDTAAANELKRSLHQGWTVYLEGSTSELSARVAAQVQALGYKVDRISAGNPSDESVATARATTSAPTWIVLADDMDYRTALSAAATAGSGGYHGRLVVLLNSTWGLPGSIASYMNGLNPSSTHLVAVGGRSIYALEHTTALHKVWYFWTVDNSSNGETLSFALADFWWGGEGEATVANNTGWQDGAVAASAAATYGPLVWTSPKYLSPDTVAFLEHESASVNSVQIYGTAGFPGNTLYEIEDSVAAAGTELVKVPNGRPPALPTVRTAATGTGQLPAPIRAAATAPQPRLSDPQSTTAAG